MNRLFFFACLLFLLPFTGSTQNKEIEQGDVYFEFFQFPEAIESYQAALKIYNPKVEAHILDRLAQCYKVTFQYEKAEEYYTKLIRLGDKHTAPDVYLDYAAILKINGDYARSREQYKYYLTLYPNDPFATAQLASLQWAWKNKDSIRNFTVTPTDLNISGQSLGYCFFDNGMIYSTQKNKGFKNDPVLMFDLEYADMKDSITFVQGENFMDGINFDLNEGSPSVSEDGLLIYFSANATKVKNGKVKKKVGGIEVSSDGIANLKIYVAKFENGKFSSPQELPFNNKEYNCMHPCIADNGKTLYFASDMPKGFGGTDIYKVTRGDDGKWGVPENLGQGINTTENEIYPYVGGKVLFFASKGLNGFGGYDLFQAKLNLGIPSAPVNMGIPFNSPKDDMAFICRSDGRTGYFSSNRDNGGGVDKVYFYIDNRILAERKPVIIASAETPKPAAKAPVEIAKPSIPPPAKPVTIAAAELPKIVTPEPPKPVVTETAKPIAPVEPVKPADQNVVNPATVSSLEIKKKEEPVVANIPVVEKKVEKAKPIEKIKPVKKVLPVIVSNDDDLTKIVFEKVYFKFNDVAVPPAVYHTLDSAIHATRISKTVKIEVSAHTDSRGKAEYNQKLSERRAAVVKQYLMKKGVASSRIITHGLGETQLLNQCTDGVECTEEQHQLNRRVEVKIVK